MSQALEALIEKELDELGFDLVEFRRGGTARRPLFDVRMDRRDGEKVSIDDCARVSRALEEKLDQSGVAGEQYVLEVSSPGMERPLKKVTDWRRFVGRRARVASPELGGKAEVELVSVEGDAGAEVAIVRTAKGEEKRLPIADVSEARLVFHWKQ